MEALAVLLLVAFGVKVVFAIVHRAKKERRRISHRKLRPRQLKMLDEARGKISASDYQAMRASAGWLDDEAFGRELAEHRENYARPLPAPAYVPTPTQENEPEPRTPSRSELKRLARYRDERLSVTEHWVRHHADPTFDFVDYNTRFMRLEEESRELSKFPHLRSEVVSIFLECATLTANLTAEMRRNCPECKGTGRITYRAMGPATCPSCSGYGIYGMTYYGPNRCLGCNGSGKIREMQTHSAKCPRCYPPKLKN